MLIHKQTAERSKLMRKFPLLLVLLIFIAFWSGCGRRTSHVNLNVNTTDKAEQIIREHKQTTSNAGASNVNSRRK